MSYFHRGLGAIDQSPCTQNPNDPVCQAFRAGTSSITGATGGRVEPGEPPPFVPSPFGPRGPSAGLPIPLLALAVGGAVVAMMLLRPKTNPSRRRRRRSHRRRR